MSSVEALKKKYKNGKPVCIHIHTNEWFVLLSGDLGMRTRARSRFNASLCHIRGASKGKGD